MVEDKDKIQKVIYLDNNDSRIATGSIISEDLHFITIQDRFEGQIRIGKRFVIKIKEADKDGYD